VTVTDSQNCQAIGCVTVTGCAPPACDCQININANSSNCTVTANLTGACNNYSTISIFEGCSGGTALVTGTNSVTWNATTDGPFQAVAGGSNGCNSLVSGCVGLNGCGCDCSNSNLTFMGTSGNGLFNGPVGCADINWLDDCICASTPSTKAISLSGLAGNCEIVDISIENIFYSGEGYDSVLISSWTQTAIFLQESGCPPTAQNFGSNCSGNGLIRSLWEITVALCDGTTNTVIISFREC